MLLERYVRGVVGTTIPILPYDSFAAEWHARERGRLAKRGHLIPFADGQIAGIAATQELILVTNNRKDFREFSGFRIEDWRT